MVTTWARLPLSAVPTHEQINKIWIVSHSANDPCYTNVYIWKLAILFLRMIYLIAMFCIQVVNKMWVSWIKPACSTFSRKQFIRHYLVDLDRLLLSEVHDIYTDNGPTSRHGRFGRKVGQNWPQMGQIRDFFRSDFSTFGSMSRSMSQIYWNLIWKSPRFVLFGANLTHLDHNSDIPIL